MLMNFIILTEQQKNDAEALNGEDAGVEGRLVDGENAPVEVAGKWVIPARVLDDEAYARWTDLLSPLPQAELDTDAIFAPPPIE